MTRMLVLVFKVIAAVCAAMTLVGLLLAGIYILLAATIVAMQVAAVGLGILGGLAIVAGAIASVVALAAVGVYYLATDAVAKYRASRKD